MARVLITGSTDGLGLMAAQLPVGCCRPPSMSPSGTWHA
jgi:hypothetical protein